ncbi:MAG: MBL fold metallo-hydrolase [Deltaproteobacteria bacterium]|jgi:glyoxylase-like metal-dependent hydrolase (beta-lactamase superfamily II)|nr:MBL fold metallo-hydrolase [Pseudomonadota bacterium]MCK5187989.1 MBL fold metallo-hydrolase [Deltaproteobacteria bacterium]NOQ87059.1 MBL fold metallo-hydrolase [Deltaproteobacteria bacterium]
MECFSIEGNRQWLDGGAMFGNAPKSLWMRWIRSDIQNRIPLACRSLIVKSEHLIILFEAGIGFYMEPKLSSRYGVEGDTTLLLKNLKKVGIAEEDVNYVILSHLHFDHAGGMVPAWPDINKADWSPHFPNATYLVGKTQYERSLSPHLRDHASYIPTLAEKLKGSGRLVLLDSEEPKLEDLKGWLTFFYTNGHTPGMMHTLIKGKRETIFFCSDIVPGTAWVNLPIVMGYDRYPEQTVNEKKIIMERAVKERWLLFYTHDPDTVASRVRVNSKGKYEADEPLLKMESYHI